MVTLDNLWNVTKAALEKGISLPRLWENGGALRRAIEVEKARKRLQSTAQISISRACEAALDYVRSGEVEVSIGSTLLRLEHR